MKPVVTKLTQLYASDSLIERIEFSAVFLAFKTANVMKMAASIPVRATKRNK